MLLGLAPTGTALLAGLHAALLGTVVGMTAGAAVDEAGHRNSAARVTALLGPLLTVALLLAGGLFPAAGAPGILAALAAAAGIYVAQFRRNALL